MPGPAVEQCRPRVLIVDDQESDRTLLAGLLKLDGYELIHAGNGIQAIELACSLRPDCMLLDIVRPELDGIETCRRLKAAPELAVIPVLGERDSRSQAIASGADDFLPTPFDLEEVRLRVRNAIRSKRLYDRVQAGLGGLKKLETARDSLAHVDADERAVRLEIHDNGPGIPAEFRERIFEKYGHVEGAPDRSVRSTGLGLAFCKLAVEAHGGSIVVENDPGAGATFRILLPR